MPEGVEIPVKLKDIDKAQKDVEGLRSSVKNFFAEIKGADDSVGRAIGQAATGAIGTIGQAAAGAGAFAFGQSGGGFQQGATAAARAGVGAIPGALATAGSALGPAGTVAGLIGGSVLAGGLSRAIDNGDFENMGIEGVARTNARGRVAQAAGAAGMFGMKFSDDALRRAILFAESFEQRGYQQSRRVLDMQVWR